MKWWQREVKGWIVSFWYSDTPIMSKRVSKNIKYFAQQARKNRSE